MSTDTTEVSAPEADEQVEGPKLMTKEQVNSRKKLGVLVEQAKRHAKNKGVEFIAFYEGVNAPMEVTASCTAQLVRAVVAHLALVANKDFNDALQTLREMFPEKPQEQEECTDSPATSTPEAQEPSGQ